MSNTLTINEIFRKSGDIVETLTLAPGVNILEGPPNSGKTVWLKFIDYLLGDTGSVEEALANEAEDGVKMYEKYTSASLSFTIQEKKFLLERNWTEPGMKGKIILNGQQMTSDNFSDFILTELQIPLLHFPQGNPLSERKWPSLSWRMMFRHMYRQERFWGDLADNQPEVQQHAVLAQFLGLAELIFSQTFGDVIQKRKELLRYEVEKEQFSQVLDSIGKSISSAHENISFLTHETVQKAIKSLNMKIEDLIVQRNTLIKDQLTEINRVDPKANVWILEKTEEREKILNDCQTLNAQIKALAKRVHEFEELQLSINSEIEKLQRAKQAGSIFADLKVTHCPACDQQLPVVNSNPHNCFLCHQALQPERAENRIEYEITQLESEGKEISELIMNLHNDQETVNKQRTELEDQLALIDRDLAPLRNTMTALTEPRIGALDTERGRLEAQVETYKKLLANLDHKDELVKKIDFLTNEIQRLQIQVDAREEDINYSEVADLLEVEMANYFNTLTKANPDRWPYDRPTFTVSERSFRFKVKEGKWSNTLGGTSRLYFLFAYHYGLLALSKYKECNYPGLLIIDVPAELPNTEVQVISESYVVQPFVDLCLSNENQPMQVIITGRAFYDMENVNRVAMKGWR